MFKKLRPFLCWGPVAQQKAIDKENEANQELEVNSDKEFECLNSDEQYTPNTKVFFEYQCICVLNLLLHFDNSNTCHALKAMLSVWV